MDWSISFDNLTKGETITFGLAFVGTLILVALSIKATVTTGTTPKLEQQAFAGVFFFTLICVGAVLISHYTQVLKRVKEAVSSRV